MEFLLGMLFVICFMFGALQVFAALIGFFAITAGWFMIILFALVGIVLPFFIFTTMFASFPVLTGILVVCLVIWVAMVIIRKGFEGVRFCIREIKRYFDERDYKKYR